MWSALGPAVQRSPARDAHRGGDGRLVLARAARARNHGGPSCSRSRFTGRRERARGSCRPSRPALRSRTRAHAVLGRPPPQVLAAQLRRARRRPPSSSSRWPAPDLHIAQIGLGTLIELFPLDARQRHRSAPSTTASWPNTPTRCAISPWRTTAPVAAAAGRVLGGDPRRAAARSAWRTSSICMPPAAASICSTTRPSRKSTGPGCCSAAAAVPAAHRTADRACVAKSVRRRTVTPCARTSSRSPLPCRGTSTSCVTRRHRPRAG